MATKEALFARIDSFSAYERGWYKGEGEVVEERFAKRVKTFLEPLLTSLETFQEFEVPSVFPMHDNTIQAIQEAFGSNPYYRLGHGIWVVSADVRESDLLKRIQEEVLEPVFVCSGPLYMSPHPDFQNWLTSKKE